MGNARFFEAACSIEFEKMKPHRNEMEGPFRILLILTQIIKGLLTTVGGSSTAGFDF